uniref:Uncharacterized protein n=1 Tax=Anguilla anguilla TaxID=7936 RepID=A0A0E9WKZ8_ANGAN
MSLFHKTMRNKYTMVFGLIDTIMYIHTQITVYFSKTDYQYTCVGNNTLVNIPQNFLRKDRTYPK